MLSQTQLLMRNLSLCLFLLLASCSTNESQNELTKATHLERLKKFDQLSNSHALHHLSDSLIKATGTNDSVFLMKVNYYKGKALLTQHKNKEVVSLYESILPFFNNHKLPKFSVRLRLYLAMAYADLGEYSQANALGVQAKNDALDLDDPVLISGTLESLSYLAYKNRDFNRALEYMHDAEAYHRKKANKIALAPVLNNLGILYRNTGNKEKAKYYQDEALRINMDNEDVFGVSKSHSNLGRIAEDKGNYNQAKEHYLKAIQISEEHGIENPIPFVNLAGLFIKANDIEQAKFYYQTALNQSNIKENKVEFRNIHTALLDIAFNENDVFEIKKHATILGRLDSKAALDEEKERVRMLEKQEELLYDKLELETKQTSAKTTQFTLFVVLILLLMILFYFIQRIRSMRYLNERNAISLELKVLRSQMNPHFIFNALTTIQNQVLSSTPIESAHSISRFAKLIRQNFEFTAKNEITLAEDLDALTNYLQTQQMRYGNKFEYVISIDENLTPTQVLIPPMLLQPFVENAIEHGFKNIIKKGVLEVTVTKLESGLIQFSIKDNGIGYDPIVDESLHATDIFKKRMRLNETGEENSFRIHSFGKNKGTQVLFNLYRKPYENHTN